jgi:tRNA uridine 5-carboxymethylaminomethyl modification enzyme
LNGFSTSLPAEVQQNLLKMIDGFGDVRIIRPGYAIEYDFIDPRELSFSLESFRIKGLFLAGQINGTTGYEEAACQGLIAGINAAFNVLKRQAFRLERNEAYIGVLIDDLIKNGVDEPYRIFTSRAEARLTLRHDNADQRLYPKGKEIGLLNDSDWENFNKKLDRVTHLREVLISTRFKRSDVGYSTLSHLLGRDLGDTITLLQFAQREGIDSQIIHRLLPDNQRGNTNLADLDTALADLLYRGYVETQKLSNERIYHNDNLKVPDEFNFRAISGISYEMIERLERAKPRTFAQVRNIPGLTPAAVSTILVHLSAAKIYS